MGGEKKKGEGEEDESDYHWQHNEQNQYRQHNG